MSSKINELVISQMKEMHKRTQEMNVKMLFKADEQRILAMFYNKNTKIDRSNLAKYQMYAEFDDNPDPKFFLSTIAYVDTAVMNLLNLEYIVKSKETLGSQSLGTQADKAYQFYNLTTEGFKIVQSWHPNIAFRFKAWLRIVPAWALLSGSIASGLAALWKIIDLLSLFF